MGLAGPTRPLSPPQGLLTFLLRWLVAVVSGRSLRAVVTRWFAAALVVVAWTTAPFAQGVELSRADRLAILYTPQLPFSNEGEPLIKIGLADGLEAIEFSADAPVELLPLGDGGSVITLPAGRRFRVAVSESEPGTYAHHVVVAELTPSERSAVGPTRSRWEQRGYTPHVVQVGSIFAVAGQRFDTRRTLIAVQQTGAEPEASALAATLQDTYGVDARVHSELDAYPGGLLTVTGVATGVTIRNRDLLWVRSAPSTTFTVYDVPYDGGTRYEGSEDREYVGSLIFTVDRNGALAVVNETTLEQIVQGVVPAEVYASAPAAALEAQAIAARSEILADLGARHLADPYMTCSDQMCQVYRGLAYHHPRTDAAVAATRGQILTSMDQVIRANYSANNGGVAASNDETWGGDPRPHLRARVDTPTPLPAYANGLASEAEVAAFLADPPDVLANISNYGGGRFRWQTRMTGVELSNAVARRYPEVGSVMQLEILSRGPSGRVTSMRVSGTDGEVVIHRELNVRRAFGGLYSALFVLEVETAVDGLLASATFDGGGFGHGVGLCQSGAIGGANRGWDAAQILAHYYPGTELRSLY
jgi:stage II sporulation protein D